MIKRTIMCGVKGCFEKYEEKKNEGFPGWGHVVGLVNDESGETVCHLCPKHLKIVLGVIKGEKQNGVD